MYLIRLKCRISSCLEAAIATAKLIAEKSPVAVQTTKQSLIYSRDNTVDDGLEHIVSLLIIGAFL